MRPRLPLPPRMALAALALAPFLAFAAALPVRISPAGWLVAGGASLLLGVLVVSAVLAAVALGRLAGALAAGGAAAVVVWSVREHFGSPRGKLAFGICVVLLAALAYTAARRARPKGSRSWPATALAAAIALVALAAPAYRGSAYLRWVLLRYDRPLGTPLFLLLGGNLETAAGRAERPASDPPPAAGTGLAAAAPATARAPSLVFLMIDTLRADALRPWGGEEVLPAFDALAREGVVFADVMADSGWTKPSVASFFTGLPVESHGVRTLRDTLAERHRTLAERFRDAGYRTAAFVTNVAQIHRGSGFEQGFDDFVELRGPLPYARAAAVRASVARWLADNRPPGPLFLYVHLLDPHVPYLAGELPSLAWPPLERSAYAAEVRYLDRELGGLVADLRAALGDPVILFASDHGEEFGEHAGAGHGATLNTEIVRVPAILVGGGALPGRLESRLLGRDFYDLLPRFAAGPVDVAAWAAGRDHEVRRSALFYRWPSMPPHRPYLRTVVAHRIEDRRWTLIRSLYGETRELYDRAVDPGERENLAARFPAEVERLDRLLEATAPPWSPADAARAPEEAAAQLRALGYL